MLYRFLAANRENILALARKKTIGISEHRPTTADSEAGLPQFYDHLIRELKREARGHPKRSSRKHGPRSTVLHGKELSRLGYTVSQVVHGYGGLCQAITEFAAAAKATISADEFSTLNLNLDVAIADAVTAFSQHESAEGVDADERVGFLVHELRNALAAAMVAHSMITKGVVGTGGSTNALLERNLGRMRDLLDRSFSVVRMKSHKAADRRPLLLIELVEEVEATASEQARSRGLRIKVTVDSQSKISADRSDLLCALSNLVQNAIKYSKDGGIISIRSRVAGRSVLLEVEDRCGGLPPGKVEELFKPYTQKHSDRSGLGLGLTISRQAVEHNGGAIAVHDLPGKGCVFTIALPRL